MDLTALAIFGGALLVAAVSPGPAIAALVARVLARGTAGAAAFSIGLAIGDVVWLTSAILGLAYIAKTFGWIFLAVKYAGAAYLLYIAWKMWTAPAVIAESGESVPKAARPLRLFAAGLSLTLGNPKTMVFYLALLPNLIDLAHVTALGYAELVVVTLSVLAVVFGGYTLLAARARRLIASPRSLRLVNRGSSAVMAGAAVAIAAR